MKTSKCIKGLLLGVIGLTILGAASCNGDNSEKPFTGFTPGVATQVRRGEIVFLEEFIDYVAEGTYTISLSGGSLKESQDLTDKARWNAAFPGEYTLTYTIHSGANAGVYTHTFVVPADTVSWSHETLPITITYEKEFTFEWLYEQLNFAVNSYYKWEAFVKNIRIGDKVIEIDESADGFFVEDFETHYITYGIRTEDGQELRSIMTANVIYSPTETDLYLNALSTGAHVIDVAGVQSVKINGKVCTDAEITATQVLLPKQTLYKNYTGTNFISMQTADGEVRDTINVYTPHVSFEEDGYSLPPNFLTLHEKSKFDKEVGRQRITDKFVTYGEKSLEVISSAYYWPQFLLHMEYLDMIFSDTDVTEFAFDVTYAGTKEEHTYRTLTLNGYGTGGMLYRNVASTIRMTRAKYEQLKADIAKSITDHEADESKAILPNGWQMTLQNTRDAAGGWDNPAKLYFDNFRALYTLEEESYLAEDTSLGNITIDVAGVDRVYVNGVEASMDNVTINSENVVLDIDWLRTEQGVKTFTLIVGDKFYEKRISVFGSAYDFEEMTDAQDAGFVAWTVNLTKNPKITIIDFNDSKALRMYTEGGYWPQVQINGDWLEGLFKDPEVTCVMFDMTLDNCGNEEVTTRSVNSNVMNNMVFEANKTVKIIITREKFEAMRLEKPDENALITMDNQTKQPGGMVPVAWILDNFEAGTQLVAYKELYDFEDGQKVDFIWPSFKSEPIAQVVEYKDSKALQMTSTAGTKDIAFEIDGGYMHAVFAQKDVTAIRFDFTVVFTISGNSSTQVKLNYDGRVFGWNGANNSQYLFDSGATQQLSITRGQYEQWAANGSATFRMVLTNRSWALEWYVDNLQVVKA